MTDQTHRPRRRVRLRWLAALAFPVLLLAGAVLPAAGAEGARSSAPGFTPSRCSATSLGDALHLPATKVDSAFLITSGLYLPPQLPAPITGLPELCAVNLTRTDPAGNPIQIAVWLPKDWNGRFQGIGGGGYSCGIVASRAGGGIPSLQDAVTRGYAAAATDCGVPLTDSLTGNWALTSDHQLNQPLITSFASAGIHQMTVTGKAVTQAFYATGAPGYSYFNGCSTGGREALMEAQRYPTDYDGIAASAPAINWTRFIPAEIWPALVMNVAHDPLPACKQTAFADAATKACDNLDGVTDGILSDVTGCRWRPDALVGTQTPCGTITSADAAVMTKILQGPTAANGDSLWYGLEPGTSPAGLAVPITILGNTALIPFPIVTAWLGRWLQRDPDWDWKTLTYAQFETLFTRSVQGFSTTIATDDPDLSAFRDHGGKVLIWHGLADPLIFPQGSIQYYQRVQQTMGGATKTAEFARLFLAPGVSHCGGGAGPAPADPLTSLVGWVEQGLAPQSIPATLLDSDTGAVKLSRPLCAYPLVARYTGQGATTDAANFTCAPSYAGR